LFNRIKIPKEFRTTLRQEDFVKYDNGFENPNRITMFSTNRNHEYLASSKYWICDGTVKMAPSSFYQLYVIIREFVDVNVPLVYILLKQNKRNLYCYVCVLKQKTRNRSFKTLVVDFKDAVVLAFKEILLTISINFCLFHFCQIFYRNL
jgi:hypothetical protein